MSNIKFVDGSATIKWVTFSDKTENCTISPVTVVGSHGSGIMPIGNHIQIDIEDGTRDIVRLALVKDAMERLGLQHIKLTIGYMPQARADRVFEEGQPLAIKVFATMLNNLKFSKVYIMDPHSDVTAALIDNVTVVPQSDLVRDKASMILRVLPDFVLVAPDAGSSKKIHSVSEALGGVEYIQCNKHRDVKTGKILSMDLPDMTEYQGRNMLIVDDITDGNGTFNWLAGDLKKAGVGKIGLCVTHAILSKGVDSLSDDIDYFFYTNRVGKYFSREDIEEFNGRH